ncbi:YcjF family protein [Elusimicrobiota bacterium]
MKNSTAKASKGTATSTEGGKGCSDRQPLALEIVKRHSAYSAAIGLLPIPLLNAAGAIGVSYKLVRDLAGLYDVPFTRDRVKSIVGALVGGLVSTEAGLSTASLMKGMPLIGPAVYVLAVPAFAGAATYAIGKVFIRHFESGGTFLDLDPSKVKAYFSEQFSKKKAAPEEETEEASEAVA